MSLVKRLAVTIASIRRAYTYFLVGSVLGITSDDNDLSKSLTLLYLYSLDNEGPGLSDCSGSLSSSPPIGFEGDEDSADWKRDCLIW